MPTYEYRCGDCRHEFETFQRMTDEPISECPECHGRAERLLSGGAGLLFKGSGFYITDYRSDSYKKEAKADGTRSESKPSESKPSGSKPSGSKSSSSGE